jgi:hypothetical protein
MERNFILGAIVVCAVGFAAAMSLKRDRAPDTGASGDSSVVHVASPPSPEAPAISPARTEGDFSSSLQERRDDALLAHVEHKYRYLLADVESAHVEELKRRLLAHEGEENISRKTTTDAHVSEMLSPREREYYQSLKDSDLEQHQLAEYVGGIGNVAPLEKSQERQILDAKLRQKQRYAATLRDSGLDRDTLSAIERQYASAQVAEALKGYLDDFLMEVSPLLTSEQYSLLRNYETTEFQRELERLQRQINSK